MKELLEHLLTEGVLKTPALIATFTQVDRADFVRPAERARAYADVPLPIGYEQTISQPYTVAFMLELLQPMAGERILDVGSGSGWTTALLAAIVGEAGRVWGVELVPELVQFGQQNVAKYTFPQASIQQATKVIGLPAEAPFDKILVSAAADTLPLVLAEQLRPGGTLVIPVDDAIWRVGKQFDGRLSVEKYGGFSFVPLIL